MTSSSIIPVVLSGGAGSRLWPLSRQTRPKQFLEITSDRSLFADTLSRIRGDLFDDPIVICHEDQRFLVAEEFRACDMACKSIITEPVSRNTAPAIAAVAMVLAKDYPHSLMLVMPSDHVIGDISAFNEAVIRAAESGQAGMLVTFGIEPNRPETGYGYIDVGDELEAIKGCCHVRQFSEKPDLETATAYQRSGHHVWNSGMFLFSPETYLAELGRLEPGMSAAVDASVEAARRDSIFLHLDKQEFTRAPAVSIDVAVMEKTDCAAVVRVDMGWSDVGAWPAFSELENADRDGNVLAGDVLTHDVKNSYIRSDHPLVAAIGVENLVIVATDDAVLVTPKDRAQDVRHIVAQLENAGRAEHISHTTVYRPWGNYRDLEEGSGFLVKEIVVKPGAKLSLQYHNHRAEHWVVVEGEASVTNGDNVLALIPGQSTYIPLGTTHRLENSGDTPLRVIEVQYGDYIGEDDIIRMEDDFGRG